MCSPRVSSLSLVLAATVLMAQTGSVYASNIEFLAEKLFKKGVLSEQEYQELREMGRNDRKNQAIEKAKEDELRQKQAASSSNSAVTKWKDGISWESADGQHSVGLTGRVHFDLHNNSNSWAKSNDRDTASIADNFEIRRVQLGSKGYFYKDIGYEVVLNGVGSNANLVDLAWMNLGFFKPIQLRMGRYSQPMSMEELSGSNSTDFIENSYVYQLMPAKKLGAMIHGVPVKGVNYGISAYQDDFSEQDNKVAKGKQLAGRIAFNFSELAGLKDSVLHFGVSGSSGTLSLTPTSSSSTSSAASTTTRGTVVGFRSEPRGLANVYRAQLSGDALATAAFGGASNANAEVSKQLQALELAAAYGPVKLQAEYLKAGFDAKHGTGSAVAGDVRAYYTEAIWNITGESWAAAYSDSKFGGIKPKSNFKPGGGLGAWQAAVRYSKYDASDIRVVGANSREQNADVGKTLTLGLNWILNPNARMMFNYSRTKFNAQVQPLDVLPANVTSDSETMFSVRGQINF